MVVHMKSKLILLLLLCLFSLHSEEFVPSNGKAVVSFSCQEIDIADCEKVFIKAFSEAYAEFSAETLAVADKEQFLKSAFADLYDEFKLGHQKIVLAKINNKIVGLVGFKNSEQEGQIYISYLAVDPEFWHQGIGKQLVWTVFDLFDNVQSLVVVTRRINNSARLFYSGLGFQESTYMHPGYNPEKYIGYELYLN